MASKVNLDAFKDDHSVQVIDANKKVRVGIIGTGWIAGAHIQKYLEMPDVEIVGGADLIEGKAEAFFEQYGVKDAKCFRSHKELIDAGICDAVSVCTYNATHAECTIYALEHGVHVLLEKPMCVTLDEAVAICKAEKASGKVLSIGFQPRFDANMKMVKEIVESGELGKVYYIQTGGGRRHGIPTPFGTTFIEADKGAIGALGDIGCYSLDMVLNAIGYPKPLTVSGYVSDFFGKDPSYFTSEGKPAEYANIFGVDDFGAAFIRLEGGIILDFRIAWAMNINSPCDTIILGTKGGLRIPTGGKNPMILYHEVGGLQVETEIPYQETKVPIFDAKIRTFLDASKNGTASPVPTSEILYNQAIIDGIAKSSALGKEIELNLPAYDEI